MPKLPTGAKLNQRSPKKPVQGQRSWQVGLAVVRCYHGFKFHTQPTIKTNWNSVEGAGGRSKSWPDLEPVRQPGDDDDRTGTGTGKIQVMVTSVKAPPTLYCIKTHVGRAEISVSFELHAKASQGHCQGVARVILFLVSIFFLRFSKNALQCNNCLARSLLSVGKIVIYSVLNFSLLCCANLTQ